MKATPPTSELIPLLKARNRCLQRILEADARFVAEWDAAPVSGEKTELLLRFQTQRDSLFKGLELYERRAVEALAELPSTDRDPALLAEARGALVARDRLAAAILDQDRAVAGRLEADKNRVLEEIAGSRRGQHQLNKFKSNWVASSGEGLDRKL